MTYYYMAVAKFQFRYKLRMSFLRTIIAGLLNRSDFSANIFGAWAVHGHTDM